MDYLKTILLHKYHVYLASKRVCGISWWQILVHDFSKFSPSEFFHYRNNFRGIKDKTGFKRGRLRHQNLNPHHWEYWILRKQPPEVIAETLEIPEKYLREMFADWLAASQTYENGWKPKEWYLEKAQRIVVHPRSRELLIKIIKGTNI